MAVHYTDDNGNIAVVTSTEKGYTLVFTHFTGVIYKTRKPCKHYRLIKELLRSYSDSWKQTD